MKTLIPILVLTFFTVLTSCDTDDTVFQENSINSNDLTIITVQTEALENNYTENARGFSTSVLTPEAAALEHTLQWISFTTANVIYNNQIAKDKFLDRIHYVPFTNNSDTIIDIEGLIGPDIPDTDPFKIAFRDHLIQLVSLFYVSGCPLGSSESPEPPLNSGTGGNGMPIIPGGFMQSNTTIPTLDSIEEMVDDFIAYILADECIEIYLPIGITSTFTEITSSAHPMNTDTMNNGYYTLPYTGCADINYETLDVNVDLDYTYNTNGPVIIARPTKSRRCLYNNFDFDFTDFLN